MKTIEKTKSFISPSGQQLKILAWWTHPQAKKKKAIICDGAVRSGKTVFMAISFVLWALTTYRYDENFAICGKTITATVRNVIKPLIENLTTQLGYEARTRNSIDGLQLIVFDGEVTHTFYIFGGHDESSQNLVQGVTLAGALFDEVALMPRSFVEETMARCSVEGSKFWFNCNPEYPKHWFHEEWIKKPKTKNTLYLHFLMTDNPSLSQETLNSYNITHTGVYHDRKVKGLWVRAEGLIYRKFADDPNKYISDVIPDLRYKIIGVDWGGNKSGHSFSYTGITTDWGLHALKTIKHDAKGTAPDDIYKYYLEFEKEVTETFGRPDGIYPDSADQTLINGLRKITEIPVHNSYKGEVNDRIHKTNLLIGSEKLYMTSDCKSLKEALCEAVWNEKNFEDERLDDGTSDIDSLDSFEYSWSWYIDYL